MKPFNHRGSGVPSNSLETQERKSWATNHQLGTGQYQLFAILFGLGEWMLGSTSLGIGLSVGGAIGWFIALNLVGAFKNLDDDVSV